jgi:sodium-dependent dicarboxylate transporter 2/3/5
VEGVSRTLHEAATTIETYSPAEERFNRRRRTVGLFLGPALFAALLVLPRAGLSPAAHRLSAVLALVIVFWITEALPMAVTALVGPVLAILLGVAPARSALAPFADPIIFLFIGSFMLAEALFVHGLDRRIAFTALSWPAVGASGFRILLMYGAVAAGVSMWISNTAATAMLFPIGMSIVAHRVRSSPPGDRQARRFALAMLLTTSFAASLGGLATPIGTPPNLIGMGMLERIAGVDISFGGWMLLGGPAAIVLLTFLAVYFRSALVRETRADQAAAAMVRAELAKLGPVTPGQRNVLAAFGVTIALWLAPGAMAIVGAGDTAFARAYAEAVPESVAAMVGAILLFVLPVSWRARRFTLTWQEAVRIDWGIILLFGGGLALGDLAFATGLAEAMGHGLTALLPLHTTLGLTLLFTGFAILMSEAASNTASAAMIVPIAIAMSQAAGVRPIEPALGATLGASMGFMMPISTPPNAIIYSSGYVPITAMMRYGIALDVAAFIVIVLLVVTLGPVVF